MNTLKLLPRWTRVLGLILIAIPLYLFIQNPEVAFGDPIFGEPDGPLTATVYQLVDEGEDGWAFFQPIKNDLSNELMLVLMLIGTWMIAFAKVRDEDEFSHQLRLQAMASAIVCNSILLIACNFLIYDGLFLYVMLSQLFSFLLIFSIIFAFKIRKFRRGLTYEE